MSADTLALVLTVARRMRWLLAMAGRAPEERGEFVEEDWR